MRVALAFGSFILALSTIVTGLWGVIASDAHMLLAGWLLAIAFVVVGFHAAEIDSKTHKERKK